MSERETTKTKIFAWHAPDCPAVFPGLIKVRNQGEWQEAFLRKLLASVGNAERIKLKDNPPLVTKQTCVYQPQRWQRVPSSFAEISSFSRGISPAIVVLSINCLIDGECIIYEPEL